MRKQLIFTAVLATLLLLATSALAQLLGANVRGVCKDDEGNPYVGAIVRFQDVDTGRKYELKTNSKGEYVQVAMSLAHYNVSLLVDGKEIFHINNVSLDANHDNVIDFDMAKERAAQGGGAAAAGGVPAGGGKPAAGGAQLSAADKEKNASIQAENVKIKAANDLIKQADAAAAANNLDQAIATITPATQQVPNQPLVWMKLSEYQMKANKWPDAVPSLEAGIKAAEGQPPDKQNPQMIAVLHDNYAKALEKTGKPADAVANYDQAAKIDPAHAGSYYFKAGAVCVNTGKTTDAVPYFDKAITADPTMADAYYWKGVALMGQAKTEGNKFVAPPGTAEAFNKYLELAPTGKNAEGAKAMLASIGADVQTGYKERSKSKPK
jgi:tetratricopeptide (TPR) repeat protein